jgi:hypothetical protein
VVAGGLLAVLCAAAVTANTDDVGVWLVIFFLIMLPCAYVSLGSVRSSYFGLQVAATFMIVMIADHPVTDIGVVLWRFWGTLVGAGVLFGVFAIVAADTAGRQLVSRFIDLLRALLAGAPRPGQPVPTLAASQASGDQITAGLADVLRLAGEARFESRAGGVDPDAALNSAGIVRRIAHRWALIRHGRRAVTRPPLPDALASASAAVEDAARQRLEHLLRVLEARHHRARPGSRRDQRARAAARALAAAHTADLDAPWAAYRAALADARAGEVGHWPIAAREALYAESGHLQRIVDLVPKLEREMGRAVLRD